jgi:molybdopterin adenylyltransferase
LIFINFDVALWIAEAMRAESLKREPAAMLSCAMVRIRGRALIVNLPGAPGTARENMADLLPAIPQAVEKIHGEGGICTGST